MKFRLILLILLAVSATSAEGFTACLVAKLPTTTSATTTTTHFGAVQAEDRGDSYRRELQDHHATHRRAVLAVVLLSSGIALGGLLQAVNALPGVVVTTAASVAAPATTTTTATLWLSGKHPMVPGQKQRDKNDVSGTRRDPNFLRSVADCRDQCGRVTGPDGFIKSREDCLQECQDICCTTYEQCSFAIIPRI